MDEAHPHNSCQNALSESRKTQDSQLIHANFHWLNCGGLIFQGTYVIDQRVKVKESV